jgi:hypothetical protein
MLFSAGQQSPLYPLSYAIFCQPKDSGCFLDRNDGFCLLLVLSAQRLPEFLSFQVVVLSVFLAETSEHAQGCNKPGSSVAAILPLTFLVHIASFYTLYCA